VELALAGYVGGDHQSITDETAFALASPGERAAKSRCQRQRLSMTQPFSAFLSWCRVSERRRST
jgi:hypothetical protein